MRASYSGMMIEISGLAVVASTAVCCLADSVRLHPWPATVCSGSAALLSGVTFAGPIRKARIPVNGDVPPTGTRPLQRIGTPLWPLLRDSGIGGRALHFNKRPAQSVNAALAAAKPKGKSGCRRNRRSARFRGLPVGECVTRGDMPRQRPSRPSLPQRLQYHQPRGGIRDRDVVVGELLVHLFRQRAARDHPVEQFDPLGAR